MTITGLRVFKSQNDANLFTLCCTLTYLHAFIVNNKVLKENSRILKRLLEIHQHFMTAQSRIFKRQWNEKSYAI